MRSGSNCQLCLLAWLCFSLLASLCLNRLEVVDSFSPTNSNSRPDRYNNYQNSKTSLCVSFSHDSAEESPRAVLLVGSSQSNEEEEQWVHALRIAGYQSVEVSAATRAEVSERTGVYIYELSRATGMLKLLSSSGEKSAFDAPTWVPMVRGEENVLVANGWSFLDPDESEPMSAFDIDDANAEAEYKPKWGTAEEDNNVSAFCLSSLGYDLSPLSKDSVLSEASSLATNNQFSRDVLLHGKTDPPNNKITCNGYDFNGSAGQSDILEGIFFTAIGGLPLFSSKDLAPTTASSGWLSFSRPLDTAHVHHVEAPKDSWDQRIEVVCSRSQCHLGHYFGPTEGYCINASALIFVPSQPNSSDSTRTTLPLGSKPVSRLGDKKQLSPSHQVLKTVLETHGRYERVVLGCGCFWHVEAALRCLQGVIETEASYAGGLPTKPTYKQVCEGNTRHAEVVSVVYDPHVLPTRILVDCFLAMHDPTMVKAHGRHAPNTGQYRSCIFVKTQEDEMVAKKCLEACRQQLGKELSTEIRQLDIVEECWRAEDEHQRHDERIQGASTTILPAIEWLKEYGRRTPSTIGGSLESSLHPDDDGMAMMMI